MMKNFRIGLMLVLFLCSTVFISAAPTYLGASVLRARSAHKVFEISYTHARLSIAQLEEAITRNDAFHTAAAYKRTLSDWNEYQNATLERRQALAELSRTIRECADPFETKRSFRGFRTNSIGSPCLLSLEYITQKDIQDARVLHAELEADARAKAINNPLPLFQKAEECAKICYNPFGTKK